MTRPEDIPADVWEIARKAAFNSNVPRITAVEEMVQPIIEKVARALLAYGQRRADEAREKAASAPPIIPRPANLPMTEWKGWDLCAQAHIIAWREERRATIRSQK